MPYYFTKQSTLHTGIIMDGNGRWALARGLSRAAGYRAGVESMVEDCGGLFGARRHSRRRPPRRGTVAGCAGERLGSSGGSPHPNGRGEAAERLPAVGVRLRGTGIFEDYVARLRGP